MDDRELWRVHARNCSDRAVCALLFFDTYSDNFDSRVTKLVFFDTYSDNFDSRVTKLVFSDGNSNFDARETSRM